MSILSQKLADASKLFQSHNFKKSLVAYEDCLNFCYKTQEEQTVIFNILSTKASLEYILGDYEKALSTLNSVLSKDPSHFLCLLRRSQVYKKTNKLGKALKDLQKIFVYCPDNLQISAFKVQVEHLLLKQGSTIDQISDSESDEQEDQEINLKFMNLKLIDRKSSDMSSQKQRKSRVTIMGDTCVEYNQEEPQQTEEEPKEEVSDKDLRTYKEIQMDNEDISDASTPINIKITTPKSSKRSILKNKGTSIFIAPDDEVDKKKRYLGRQSKLLHMLKDIDGKVIHSQEFQHLDKEVLFRKSVSQRAPLETVFDPTASCMSNQSSYLGDSRNRKSCLKRSSFQVPLKPQRRSKFQDINLHQLDGNVIHPKKKESITNKGIEQQQNSPNDHSDSDNESSSHNIFGEGNIVMTEDIKLKLGISQYENDPMSNSLNLHKKQSILKKNSSVMMSEKKPSLIHKQSQLAQSQISSGFKPALKSKKSVMFNCTM